MYGYFANAQETITITGRVINNEDLPVYLKYVQNGKYKRDTLKTDQGAFKQVIPYPENGFVELGVAGFKKNWLQNPKSRAYTLTPPLDMMVAPGDQIQVQGDAMKLWEAQVSGGKYSGGQNEYRSFFVPILSRDRLLMAKEYEALGKQDTLLVKTVQLERKNNAAPARTLTKEFYSSHPKDKYAMYLFSKDAYSLSLEELRKIYGAYTPELKTSTYGKEIAAYIEKQAALAIGKQAINFTGTTDLGKSFDLKALEGKYVMLDFWGSWCVPCRQSNPHLKEVYQKYHSQGLEIVGIAKENGSLENSRKAWLTAISTDALPWIQLLNNELLPKVDVVKDYAITAFPTKILLDKTGKIIWKSIGGDPEELDKKMKEIFKN